MDEPLRVLIVDDTVTYRKIVAEVLAGCPDVQVVGTAANGRIALQRLEQQAADLLLLDLEMPEMDGQAVLTELKRRNSPTGAIMLSALRRKGPRPLSPLWPTAPSTSSSSPAAQAWRPTSSTCAASCGANSPPTPATATSSRSSSAGERGAASGEREVRTKISPLPPGEGQGVRASCSPPLPGERQAMSASCSSLPAPRSPPHPPGCRRSWPWGFPPEDPRP